MPADIFGMMEFMPEATTALSAADIAAMQPAVYGEGLGSLLYDTEPGWAGMSQVAQNAPQYVDRGGSGGAGDLSKWWEGLSNEKKLLYGVGLPFLLSNMMSENRRYRPPGQEKYSGPMSQYSFNPSTYRPYQYAARAQGGLTSLAVGGQARADHPMKAVDDYYTQAQTDALPQVLAKAKAGDYNAMLALNRMRKTPNQNYAGGGPVEMMSNANAVGANTGFPMADISRGAYATPYQQPISQNVLSGGQDTRVDPYTGEERLADGGVTGTGGLDLHIPINFGGGNAGGNLGGTSGGNSNYPFQSNNNAVQTPSPSTPNFTIRPMQVGLAQAFGGQNPTQLNTQGYGPQGPAVFSPDYLRSMQTVRGTPGNPFGQQGPRPEFASGGLAELAAGGMYNLGGYSDGGRLLRGPGDGVSDSIPAVIGNKQPARLADGEFVVPARIVSELGNGSTEAGARKLYAMMDRVQKARGKTTGKERVAKDTKADRHLPA